MGQPKRKQSKRRSRLRRGADQFKMPQLAKDPIEGGLTLSHRVPATGMYHDRQVVDIKA